MTIPQLPLDIYLLLLPFLPSLPTHLSFSQTSSALRQHLYPSDHTSWLRLLHDFGYSYECIRGEGKEERPAREGVVELVGRMGEEGRGRVCRGRVVMGIEAGGEGVLGEVSYGSVCEKAKRWNDEHPSFAPFTLTEIRNLSLPLDIHPFLPFRGYERVMTIPNVLDHDWDEARDQHLGREVMHDEDVRLHPEVAESFATHPPVTELHLFLGGVRVVNLKGVRIIDVRLALRDDPNLSNLGPRWIIPSSRTDPSSLSQTKPLNPVMAKCEIQMCSNLSSWQQRQPGRVLLGSNLAGTMLHSFAAAGPSHQQTMLHVLEHA